MNLYKIAAIILGPALALSPSSASAASGPPKLAGVWDGAIGGQSIRVCFNERDWGMVGAYYYRAHLQAIPLRQPEDKRSTLVEGQSDAKAARWTIERNGGDTLAGQWSQGARKLPLKLSRVPDLRLKEDETPCASMLFQGPRVAGVRVVSRPALKDNFAYTRLILDHRGRFGDNVNVETFALGGDAPPIRKINAKLRAPLAGDPPEWLECERNSWNYGTGGAENHEIYEPRMASRRWLVALHHWDGFCGGAHPDSSNTPMLFDRETGQQVDVFAWFNAQAVKRDRTDRDVLSSLQPAFRDLILSGWRPENEECGDAIRNEEFWDAELTRAGVVFTPQLPHVVQACEEDFRLSFAKLQPWLSEEGRKQTAALQAEAGGKH